MKSLLIAIKPKWCALIMNGNKTIEVRKNKALANAIQKLINENGYADIYVYCSKDKEYANLVNRGGFITGMVAFKFRCYKVEEIKYKPRELFQSDMYYVGSPICNSISSLIGDDLYNKSCLTHDEMHKYLEKQLGYAIHISDLEIFDEPKRINEFIKHNKNHIDMGNCLIGFGFGSIERLTKAPQNMVYIEGE